MPPALWPGASTFPGSSTFPGQPQAVWHVLWASFDDVSVAHHERTWVDLSARLRPFSVEGGRDSELDEVDATNALYVLDDRDRELDPTNAASTYAPDVVPNRLLWHRIHADGLSRTVFLGYVNGWGPSWETGSPDNRAHVTCTDGTKRLNQQEFPFALLDVAEYDELVSALDPSFYYRLGEPQGTKLVGHRRVIRYKKGEKKGKRKRVKRWKTRETRAATTGVSGPSGTYKNTPLLGQPGMIAGDPDKAIRMRSASSEFARVIIEETRDSGSGGSADGATELTDTNRFTMACWINVTLLRGARQSIIAGPGLSGGSAPVFHLHITPADRWGSWFLYVGGAAISATSGPLVDIGVDHFLAATWNGITHVLYLDGVQVASDTPPGGTVIRPGGNLDGDRPWFQIGSTTEVGAGGEFLDARVDEVMFLEKALTQPQVQALFNAAALGFDSMTTGTRIANVLELVDEFPIWNIHAGTRTMPPTRYAGLPPAQLIDEAVDGEGMPSYFHFSREGIPTSRPANYRDDPPFDTALFTFGPGVGELPIQEIRLADQDKYLFNVISATREGGDQTFTAEDATSISRFGRSVLTLDDLPIGNDSDAQDLVDELLARYKDPFDRIEGFTVVGTDAARREAILTLDLQDCVEVIALVPKGAEAAETYTQTSYIERRHVWQDPGQPLRGEFSVSPR